MFDNFEMTLIRIEGLGDLSKANCISSMNNEIVDIISIKDIENSHHIITIPSRGELKISIEDNSPLASLRFNMSIIKCQGYHWLPLFFASENKIQEVPEEVGLPRILLIFQSRKFLSPVIEITETSEISENIEYSDVPEILVDETIKNTEMRMRIMELEKSLQFEKLNSIKNIETISRDFRITFDKLNFEIEKYKIWSEKYKEKCANLSEELEKKTKNLAEICDEKDIINAELTLYKLKYNEQVKSQESMLLQLESKEKEINSLKKLIETRPSLDIEPQEDIIANLEVKKIIRNKKPKSKLINLQVTSPLKSKENLDSVHELLVESLNKLKLSGLFVRCNEHFYKVGCKKVAVVVKNGSIYCKLGDTYKTLENYIYSHCGQELENFIKKRVMSKPDHRRYYSFSNSFDNTISQDTKNARPSNRVKTPKYEVKSITPQLVRNKKKF